MGFAKFDNHHYSNRSVLPKTANRSNFVRQTGLEWYRNSIGPWLLRLMISLAIFILLNICEILLAKSHIFNIFQLFQIFAKISILLNISFILITKTLFDQITCKKSHFQYISTF